MLLPFREEFISLFDNSTYTEETVLIEHVNALVCAVSSVNCPVNILFCRYHLTQSERPRIFCLTSKKEITKARESIWTRFGINVVWSEHGIIVQNIETSNVFYGLICPNIIHVFENVICILFYVWREISVKNSYYCISNVLN